VQRIVAQADAVLARLARSSRPPGRSRSRRPRWRPEGRLVSAVPRPHPSHRLLAGRTVLVNRGGGTGIGFAAARRCVEEGARVAISDRHERRLGEAADQLAEISGERPLTVVLRRDLAGARAEFVRHRDCRVRGTWMWR